MSFLRVADIGSGLGITTTALLLAPSLLGEVRSLTFQQGRRDFPFTQVFQNAETNKINVVYKRNSGDVGLIEPEQAA